MDKRLSSRLDAALNLKGQKDRQAAEKLQAEERAKQEVAQKRKTAVERWEKSYSDLQQAITNVNGTISGHDMELAIGSEENSRSSGLAQVHVVLSGVRGSARKVVFNVDTLGSIHPVLLIPHTGERQPRFEISGDDVAAYEAILVDFIDQVVKAIE
ncbi:hypothetical protein [Teichococcus vastitatis]|uniref:hypothetical protein n=1 Tax=Teichococcus vastitatis TaxID=2307076 RepID=UPI001300B35F|nr:hypothetical protein [Pseudoroseomonas vastitatis]